MSYICRRTADGIHRLRPTVFLKKTKQEIKTKKKDILDCQQGAKASLVDQWTLFFTIRHSVSVMQQICDSL